MFTSHVKEELIKSRSGDKYHRVFPTIGKQGRQVVEALVDMFFYIDYMRLKGGEDTRVIVTQGDETVWAGSRKTGTVDLPRFLPLMKEGGYEVIARAFKGEAVGINPVDLMASRASTEATRELLRKG